MQQKNREKWTTERNLFLSWILPLFCSKEHKALRPVVQFFVINYYYVITQALCIMLHGAHICHQACFLQYTLLICNTASRLLCVRVISLYDLFFLCFPPSSNIWMIIQLESLSFMVFCGVLVLMVIDGETLVLPVLGFINTSPLCALGFICSFCWHKVGFWRRWRGAGIFRSWGSQFILEVLEQAARALVSLALCWLCDLLTGQRPIQSRN